MGRSHCQQQSHYRSTWWGLLPLVVTILIGCGKSEAAEPSKRLPASPPGIAPIGAGGMGLDESSSKKTSPAPATPAPPATTPGAATPPAPAAPGTPASSSAEPSGAKDEAKPASPPEIPLPEDISQWRREHYYQAKKSKDRRLNEAVMYLGEHFAGSSAADSAVVLLANLLKPDKTEKPPEPNAQAPAAGTPAPQPASGRGMRAVGRPGTAPGQPSQPAVVGMDPDLIKAIVYAMGATKTASGRNILKELLAGTFEVDNDRVATAASLESLAFYACPENEEILLTVFTDPESIRKAEASQESSPPAQPVPSQPVVEPAPEKSSRDRPQGFVSPPATATPPPATATPPAAAETEDAPPGSPSALPTPEAKDPSRKEKKKYLFGGDRNPAFPGGSAISGVPATDTRAGKMSPREMQIVALAWLQQSASQQTRTKIAQHFQQASLSTEVQAQCLQFLGEMHPDNVAAQLILYRSASTNEETKAALWAQLTRFSSAALGAILGIPDGVSVPPPPAQGPGGLGLGPGRAAGPAAIGSAPSWAENDDDRDNGRRGWKLGGVPGMNNTLLKGQQELTVALDAETGYRIAACLWGNDLVSEVQGKLTGAASLSTEMPQVLLASTMPLDTMRARLFELLKKSSEEGPGALGSSALFTDVVFEPGFLVAVKLMPRKDRPTIPVGITGPSRSNSRSNRGRTRPSQPTAVQTEVQKQQKQDQIAQEWMRISEGVLRALCARLKAAAGPDVPKDLPIELPTSAQVTGCYCLEWPTDAAKQMSGVPQDPMKVYYVCLEQKIRPSGALGFFKHRMTSPTVHELEKDIWAESFRLIPNTDRRHSLDVLITMPEPTTEQPPAVPQPQQEVNLTIEVLSIELKDPVPAQATAEAGQ